MENTYGPDNCKVFVGSIPVDAERKILREEFDKWGGVVNVYYRGPGSRWAAVEFTCSRRRDEFLKENHKHKVLNAVVDVKKFDRNYKMNATQGYKAQPPKTMVPSMTTNHYQKKQSRSADSPIPTPDSSEQFNRQIKQYQQLPPTVPQPPESQKPRFFQSRPFVAGKLRGNVAAANTKKLPVQDDHLRNFSSSVTSISSDSSEHFEMTSNMECYIDGIDRLWTFFTNQFKFDGRDPKELGIGGLAQRTLECAGSDDNAEVRSIIIILGFIKDRDLQMNKHEISDMMSHFRELFRDISYQTRNLSPAGNELTYLLQQVKVARKMSLESAEESKSRNSSGMESSEAEKCEDGDARKRRVSGNCCLTSINDKYKRNTSVNGAVSQVAQRSSGENLDKAGGDDGSFEEKRREVVEVSIKHGLGTESDEIRKLQCRVAELELWRVKQVEENAKLKSQIETVADMMKQLDPTERTRGRQLVRVISPPEYGNQIYEFWTNEQGDLALSSVTAIFNDCGIALSYAVDDSYTEFVQICSGGGGGDYFAAPEGGWGDRMYRAMRQGTAATGMIAHGRDFYAYAQEDDGWTEGIQGVTYTAVTGGVLSLLR